MRSTTPQRCSQLHKIFPKSFVDPLSYLPQPAQGSLSYYLRLGVDSPCSKLTDCYLLTPHGTRRSLTQVIVTCPPVSLLFEVSQGLSFFAFQCLASNRCPVTVS